VNTRPFIDSPRFVRLSAHAYARAQAGQMMLCSSV
jgi:hypothetical protein